jgi:hypothetical protein
MKYLLLLNNTAEQTRSWETLSDEEAARIRAEEIPKWGELFAWVEQKGIEVDGLELDLPSKSKTVRVRHGETLVTDGPYVETKELVGGYFLVELDDLDQAIELAARVPVARKGSVEIRPLIEAEASA